MSDDQGRGGTVRRVYANFARLLGGKAAGGLVSLGYLAIAARTLGPGDYGVLVLVHGYAMAVGGIVEFPGWHAVVRYGAQAVAAEDGPRLMRLLRFAGLVELAAGLLAVAVAAALAPIVGPRLGWSPTALAFAGPYSLAVLASIRATPAGYLQLAGRFDLLGLHSLVPPVVRLAGAAIVALLGAGLKGFLIAWLVAALAEWAALWLFGALVARRRLQGPLLGSVRGVTAENPGLWRFMLGANADITLADLSARLAPLAVGWILGPVSAGLFAAAQRATVILSQPAQILGQASYAEFARLAAAGGPGSAVRKALVRCVAIALVAALPVLGAVALFGKGLVVLIAGAAFAGAAPVMLWLALARTLLLVGPPISAALRALGRPGLSVTANVATGLGLLVALPPMLLWLGLIGAGVFCLLQALAAVGMLGWFMQRETAAPNPVRAPG